MFMLGMLKTILKTVLKYEKTPSHFTASVEIERQISFFSFGFACVSEVRHMQIGHVIVSRHLFPKKSYYLCIVFIKNGYK